MNNNLTATQIHSLEHALRARHRVLTELVRHELLNSEHPDYIALAGTVHDTKDESMAGALRNVELAVVEMHIEELQDITNAEQRLASGTYGQCLECDQAIGFRRLSAYPTAKRCFSCQSLHEVNAREGHLGIA